MKLIRALEFVKVKELFQLVNNVISLPEIPSASKALDMPLGPKTATPWTSSRPPLQELELIADRSLHREVPGGVFSRDLGILRKFHSSAPKIILSRR